MASWWPSEAAIQAMPDVAKGMNRAEKIVCSRTLKKAEWNNTRLLKENLVAEITKLKNEGREITILGSGRLVTFFSEHGLIDEYQFMIDPIAIGEGTPVFNGMKKELELELVDSKVFKSGIVLVHYRPKK